MDGAKALTETLREHKLVIAIITVVIIAIVVAVFATANFLVNNKLIDVTSSIAKMWSDKNWEEVSSYYLAGDGNGGGHWVYNYGYVWHYHVKLNDGHEQEVSSGDYTKLHNGNDFTYQKWVPKDEP